MKSDFNLSYFFVCLVLWILVLYLLYLVVVGKVDEVLFGLYNVMTYLDESIWVELGEFWLVIGV